MWKWTADAVALLHVAWIAAFVLGPLGGLRRPGVRAAHLSLLWITAGMWHYYCPLTVIENMIRVQYDPAGAYGGGFLNHCLENIVDLTAYGKPLALGVLAWAAAWSVIYGGVWTGELKKKGALATSKR